MSTRSNSNSQAAQEPMGCLPALARIFWLALGNILLFAGAALVAQDSAPVIADVGFFAVALSMIGVRYVDIVVFEGTTKNDEPATLAHWRRYALLVALVATGVWGLARVVAWQGWL